jgi:hypothetical protein
MSKEHPTRNEINERIAEALRLKCIDSEGVIHVILPSEPDELVDLCEDTDITYTIRAADELVLAKKIVGWDLSSTDDRARLATVIARKRGRMKGVSVSEPTAPTHAHRLALALYRALEDANLRLRVRRR